jgi:hypothetical protein
VKKRFWADKQGSVGLLLGVAFPVSVGAAPRTADSAALAATQQVKLANTSDAVVSSIAQSTAQANIGAVQDQLSVDTQILQKRTRVEVTLSDTMQLSWGKIIGMSSVVGKATGTAQLFGPAGKLCMLALDVRQGGTLHLEKNSQVTANDCVVYSNSKDKQGLQADNRAAITASMMWTVCGYAGGKARLNPVRTSDCPSMTDPVPECVGSATQQARLAQ